MELTNKEMREVLSQRAMDIFMSLKYSDHDVLGGGLNDDELYKKIEQLYYDSKEVLINAD